MKRHAPYCIGLAFLFQFTTLAQSPYLPSSSVVIRRISIDDGLTSRLIRSITQDSKGFIWIGANPGVNRYDGNEFLVANQGKDSTTISHNDVWGGVCSDRDGIVWVGTTHGLNRFNPSTRSFKKYFHDPRNPASLSSDSINCIYRDRQQNLWVGTGHGLNRLNRETETWTRYYPNPGQTSRPADNDISQVLEDRQGTLWVATGGSNDQLDGGGLFIFDKTDGRFIPVGPRLGVRTLFEDRTGELWVSMLGPRLFKMDTTAHKFIPVLLPPREPGSAAFQGVRAICEDRAGYLWMATSGWTLLRYDKRSKTFSQFASDPQNPETVSSKGLTSIFVSSDGVIWVGTNRGGINTVTTKPFHHLHTLGSSVPLTGRTDLVFQDNEGLLWAGSLNGLWRFNPETGASVCILPGGMVRQMLQDKRGTIWIMDRYSIDTFDPRAKKLKTVWHVPTYRGYRDRLLTMMLDSGGQLWVGGTSTLFMISRDLREYKVFRHDPHNPKSISRGGVHQLAEDRAGHIWVGTYEGANLFDQTTEEFLHFVHDTTDNSSISNTLCTGLLVDKKGQVWIGTGNGLNLYDEATGKFRRFYDPERPAGSGIRQLQEDLDGNLWFAFPRSVFKFNTVTKTFERFDRSDGIEDVEILFWSHTVLKTGELLFGTNDGILVFHPDNVHKSTFVPPIVIAGIKKFNQEIRTECEPELLREISFTHEENVFSISFSALSYDMSEYNQYAYKLEGFDKDWVYCRNRNEATYTNLDPGMYTFRVKGSNHDRVWNEQGTSLRIVIIPPWWQTRLAYILYAFFIIGTTHLAWRLQLRRVRTRHALQMTRLEAEKLHEVDEMKSRFFANISHEFRTPLTLILGPVQQMAEQTDDEKTRENLGIVHRNARKLLSLVNQLLDFAKLESGAMKLHAVPRNVIPILRGIVLSFGPYAERKKTTLKFSTPEDELVAYIDKEKFERIVTNILSNAFKFTPEGGVIELHVTNDANAMVIQISDTGIGIPQEKIPRVFDRFYQVNSGHTREQEGTGIGLALTKELVDLHKGSISVESEEGKGSVFSVRIPLGKSHLNPEDISGSLEIEAQEAGTDPEFLPSDGGIVPASETGFVPSNGKPILLVVEDNADVRTYIQGIVEAEYELLEASDGETGWQKASEDMPDIIVSDIMMPKMDGFTLCERLKTDERTSHIPVILLTAKATSQDKIHGFETGADEYITKPFEPEELKARIKNLLAQRQRLHEHFQKHGFPAFDNSKLISIDKKFLQKVFHIITDNIGSPSFNVESLAEMAAVSRSVLRRKIVSLTGEPPVELIRRVRLSRAAELIEKNYGNMSEIALEVGFTNPSYFSECFRKQYGVAPSNYPRK